MRFLGVQDTFKRPPLEREHVNCVALHASGRIADHVDEAVERMQPAEQIIVLAIAPGKESREIIKTDSFQAFQAFETFERVHLLWADAVDPNLVQFASVAPCRDRESEHIPERKPEIIDQDLPTCVRMPLGGPSRLHPAHVWSSILLPIPL
jgi:hypothetical protein